MKTTHILNGDSLLYQLKKIIKDEQIVFRECLIDGNVQGKTLKQFYLNRAEFIAQYDGFTAASYYEKSAQEIDKIANISIHNEVVCWFEDDLFCQANFWFVINLLIKNRHQGQIFLVRPDKGNEYSFANMSDQAIFEVYKNKQQLTSYQKKSLAKLWPYYCENDVIGMKSIAKNLNSELPFLMPAIQAHHRREPDESGLGYPERQLLSIMKELDSTEFGAVFRCFTARERIYSFGDLQVKQMFERLLLKKV